MKTSGLKLKATMIISVCMLLVGTTINAALPQGKWTAEKISIEKNTDGIIENAVYNSAAEVKSYIPCPQEWEVKDAQTILFHYANGGTEECKYSIKNDQLTVPILGAILVFHYTVNNGKMTLTRTHDYDYNQPEGYVAHITEKWTIILNNQ